MSDAESIHVDLTHEEAAVALLLITLGTDVYECKEPDFEAIEQLNRLAGKHVRTLALKLDVVADKVFRRASNGL